MGVRGIATGMRGVINTAALAQKESGLSFKPFNQYLMGYDSAYDEWLSGGMCRGLSIKYLACVKNGEEFTEIVTTASMNKFTQTKVLGVLYIEKDEPIHREIVDASLAGNVFGGDNEAFCDYVKTTYALKKEKSQVFKDGKAATVKSAFEFAAHDGCYSIVSFPRHTMAVVGVKGIKHFLEPNCGIIIGPKEPFLAAIDAFFSHQFVQAIYKMTDPTFSIKVTRFTA
jgi:hypothetical protein